MGYIEGMSNMYYAMLSLLTESVHRAATSCSAGFSGCRHFQELDK